MISEWKRTAESSTRTNWGAKTGAVDFPQPVTSSVCKSKKKFISMFVQRFVGFIFHQLIKN